MFIYSLASIHFSSASSIQKTEEDYQLHFLLWCHFYFLSHSIPTLIFFGFPFHFDYRHTWGLLRDFHKPLSLKRRFPTFHYRTSSFCCNLFFHENPQNYCKVNSYPPLQGNKSGQPHWNFGLLYIRSSVYVQAN